MKKRVKCVVICLMCMVLFTCTCVPALGAGAKTDPADPGLQFHENGGFKILLIADTQDNHRTQSDTVLFIEKALDQEKPDLVIFLGDVVAGFGAWGIYPYMNGANEKNVAKAIDTIVKPVVTANIPFAVVFGNHDSESGVSKEKQMLMYQSYPNCLAYEAQESLTGCGTYHLLIKDHTGRTPLFNLYLFDSGTYKTDLIAGDYANLGEDQLAWYKNTSVALAKENGGKPLPSFAFQHIIVPDFYQTMKPVDPGTQGSIQGYKGFSDRYWVLDEAHEAGERSLRDYTRPELGKGRILEAPASPSQGNGQFQGWKEQGDVIAGFFGHDHTNEAVTQLDGIDLAYVPGCGFFMYGNGAESAMRVLELKETDVKNYKTRLIFFKDVVGRAPKNLTNMPYNGNLAQCVLALCGLALSVILLLVLFIYEILTSIKYKKR